MRGRIGGVLKDEYNGNIAFGQLEPSISFANSKSICLSQKGEKNIEVKITNVAKLKLIVSKIYENNLLAAQRNGYYPREAQMQTMVMKNTTREIAAMQLLAILFFNRKLIHEHWQSLVIAVCFILILMIRCRILKVFITS